MQNEKALELLNKGILKKGCQVKMQLKGFDEFTSIDDAYIKGARPGELEDDWVVIIIDGKPYDVAWIEEIKPCTEDEIKDYDNLTNDDCRLLEVIGWQGKVIQHSSGNLYLILDTHVRHIETDERMILYKALYDDCKTYIAPVKIFMERCSPELFEKRGLEFSFQLVKLEKEKTDDNMG